MKIEIEIPYKILEPVRKTAKGLNIPLQRALAVMLCDWIARQDMEIQRFGKPSTVGYRAFDWQFSDDTPEGYELKSSYELSRSNHEVEFLEHYDFYQERADALEEEDFTDGTGV